jgi:hypothetical protein
LGKRRPDYRNVLALVPGMTLDELESYADSKQDNAPLLKIYHPGEAIQ